CSALCRQASCVTFSVIVCYSSVSKGGSSRPGSCFFSFTQKTSCAIVTSSLEDQHKIISQWERGVGGWSRKPPVPVRDRRPRTRIAARRISDCGDVLGQSDLQR